MEADSQYGESVFCDLCGVFIPFFEQRYTLFGKSWHRHCAAQCPQVIWGAVDAEEAKQKEGA